MHRTVQGSRLDDDRRDFTGELDHLPGFAVLIQQGIEARPHPDLARVLAYAFKAPLLVLTGPHMLPQALKLLSVALDRVDEQCVRLPDDLGETIAEHLEVT